MARPKQLGALHQSDPAGADDSQPLQQQLPDLPDADARGDSDRDDSRDPDRFRSTDDPRSSDKIRQWLGDSRGRWEGDTLVVETNHFHDRLDGGDYQPSHILQTGHRGSGATLRIVEWFTRVDAETIDYRFTIEDPVTYTRPYTVAIPMRWRQNQDPIHEYACHEGNYAMVNLLRAGRVDEQLALDAAALVSRQRIEAGHPGIREPAVPFVPSR